MSGTAKQDSNPPTPEAGAGLLAWLGLQVGLLKHLRRWQVERHRDRQQRAERHVERSPLYRSVIAAIKPGCNRECLLGNAALFAQAANRATHGNNDVGLPSGHPAPNADYLVVIQLLSHPHGRPYDHIQRALQLNAPETLDSALASLEQDGVIIRRSMLIEPSDALRRLDDLNLIAI